MKKRVIVILALLGAIVSLSGCTEGCNRELKSIKSNLGGGLNRTVKAYDYNGNLLGEWEGKFDISENDQEITFDIDGKRVIIHNAIVISEEN